MSQNCSPIKLSIVLPAYNEASKIHWDLMAAQEFLSSQSFDSELLVVDDGSRDNTAEVVERYLATQTLSKPKIRYLRYEKNAGKGYAVRYGILESKGAYVGFVDCGLCVPYRYCLKALQLLEDEGADVAIASRRVAGTQIVSAQPLYRRWGSKVFLELMRLVMGIKVTDTQCGFKFYRSEVAKQLFSQTHTRGFMFDVEVLMLAARLGLSVKEFGVQWSNDGDSRYHPIFGTLRNFRELLKIRLRLLGVSK